MAVIDFQRSPLVLAMGLETWHFGYQVDATEFHSEFAHLLAYSLAKKSVAKGEQQALISCSKLMWLTVAMLKA